MNLSQVLKLECCELNFQAKDKAETIHKLAKLAKKNKILKDIDENVIANALLEREAKGSTGFGKGIAIPHCQIDGIKSFVICLAVSSKGIEFDSLDRKKAKIFVTIIGPSDNRTEHLKYLAKISSVLKNNGTVENLLKSSSVIQMYEEFIRNADADLLVVEKKGKQKLMLLFLQDDDILEDVTEILVEFGIQDVSFVETQKMENLMSKVPLFLGFFNFTGETNKYGKIILFPIQKTYISAFIHELNEHFGDLDMFSGLNLIVLDILMSKGF
jgi:PTS system nitrogen regulatory IIA component